jgi:hypothetical protein
VLRVYINSLESSQVRLYYSKFTPREKVGTICIVHGYGESSDDYIQVSLSPRRWPSTSRATSSWST